MASEPDAAFATVILGDEYDDALRARLMETLRGMGAIASGQPSWAVAGSQELEELEVDVEGQPLHIEAETYIGLSIRGAAELVGRIQRELAARAPAPGA